MKYLRFLLFPFAIFYDLITSIRNLLFEIGFFKQTSFQIPVLVVGNLSVGGTGKTPQIEYLIRLLENNFKIAVLSRGYKRSLKGFVLLNTSHSAADVGDEPLQYFKKFKSVYVAVDANRVRGISTLLSLIKPEIILLDDGYQHRKVKGSFYILLTKFDDLFLNDFLLPTGNLRENRSGAKRADVILVTKCPGDLSIDSQNTIRQQLKKYHKNVFFTNISYEDKTAGKNIVLVDELKNYEVLLVTGIANPSSLISYLKEKNIAFKHLEFPDHYHFKEADIKFIETTFKGLKSLYKMILTTEKDYVRLENKLNTISFLSIKTSFLNNQKQEFDVLVTNHTQKF